MTRHHQAKTQTRPDQAKPLDKKRQRQQDLHKRGPDIHKRKHEYKQDETRHGEVRGGEKKKRKTEKETNYTFGFWFGFGLGLGLGLGFRVRVRV
jgi:hypothetical protein